RGGHRGGLLGAEQGNVHRPTLTQARPAVRSAGGAPAGAEGPGAPLGGPGLSRARNICSHDPHRRRSRRPADPLEDTEGRVLDLPDPGLGPEATAIQRERADAIRVALLALPHDFRVAVVLRDVNQLSYEEMAEALSVPLGTVKSRISRARGLLAAALRQSSAVFPSAEEAWGAATSK